MTGTPEHVELAKVFLDEILSYKFWRDSWDWLTPKQKNDILNKFQELSYFAFNAARGDEREKVFRRIDALKQQMVYGLKIFLINALEEE